MSVNHALCVMSPAQSRGKDRSRPCVSQVVRAVCPSHRTGHENVIRLDGAGLFLDATQRIVSSYWSGHTSHMWVSVSN